jgi:hypothetical protein
MGVFAEYLHIPPWDMERLTEAQFTALADYIDAKNKE